MRTYERKFCAIVWNIGSDSLARAVSRRNNFWAYAVSSFGLFSFIFQVHRNTVIVVPYWACLRGFLQYCVEVVEVGLNYLGGSMFAEASNYQ